MISGMGSYEVGVSLEFERWTFGETLFVVDKGDGFLIVGGRPGLEGP